MPGTVGLRLGAASSWQLNRGGGGGAGGDRLGCRDSGGLRVESRNSGELGTRDSELEGCTTHLARAGQLEANVRMVTNTSLASSSGTQSDVSEREGAADCLPQYAASHGLSSRSL